MKKRIVGLIILCLMMTLSTTIANAQGIDTEEKIEKIAEYMGLEKEEVNEQIDIILSQDDGKSRQFIVDTLYEEIVVDADNNQIIESYPNTRVSDPLPTNQVKGRVFYTPVKTSGWNHGHAGLYSASGTVVHAPGTGKTVTEESASNVSAPTGSKIGVVDSVQADRDKAVAWAKGKIGTGYSLSINNMSCTASVMNCSQLVYCAYKQANIPLNNGSVYFVSPADIINNSNVSVVWTR